MTRTLRWLVVAVVLAVQSLVSAGALGAEPTVDTVRDALVGVGNSSGNWTENVDPEPNCVWTTSTWIGAPR